MSTLQVCIYASMIPMANKLECFAPRNFFGQVHYLQERPVILSMVIHQSPVL